MHAFREKIDALAASHSQLTRRYCYDAAVDGDEVDAQGLLSTEQLASGCQSRAMQTSTLWAHGFMRSVKQSLSTLGVPDAQVHYEFFGPAEALA